MKKVYRSFKKNISALIRGTRKANFFIVGAQKCGTTSLHVYLNQMPGFHGSSPKELHYFDREDNYSRGAVWYDRHFIDRGEGYYFETSPSYLARKKVPERIHEYNPEAKIIIILREPVDRAYSAWNMYRQWSEKGVIPSLIQRGQYGEKESLLYEVFFKNGCPAFSEYIKIERSLIQQNDLSEEPSILRRGIYYPQIRRYIDVFGRANVMILGFNDLIEKTDDVISSIADFVSENTFFLRSGFSIEKVIKNKRPYASGIGNTEKEILRAFYAEHNALLFEYLGQEINW